MPGVTFTPLLFVYIYDSGCLHSMVRISESFTTGVQLSCHSTGVEHQETGSADERADMSIVVNVLLNLQQI